MNFIKRIEEVDNLEIGNKALNLKRLTKQNINVPKKIKSRKEDMYEKKKIHYFRNYCGSIRNGRNSGLYEISR